MATYFCARSGPKWVCEGERENGVRVRDCAVFSFSFIRETILILSFAQKLLKVLLFGLIRFLSNNKKQQTANRQTEKENERDRE